MKPKPIYIIQNKYILPHLNFRCWNLTAFVLPKVLISIYNNLRLKLMNLFLANVKRFVYFIVIYSTVTFIIIKSLYWICTDLASPSQQLSLLLLETFLLQYWFYSKLLCFYQQLLIFNFKVLQVCYTRFPRRDT